MTKDKKPPQQEGKRAKPEDALTDKVDKEEAKKRSEKKKPLNVGDNTALDIVSKKVSHPPEKEFKKRSVEVKKITLNLRTALTRDEIFSYAEDLANADQNIIAIESRKKEMMAAITAEAKQAQAASEALSLKVSTKHEYRDVDCEVTYNFDTMTKTTVRIDTGEVVYTNKLTQSDLQQTFDSGML